MNCLLAWTSPDEKPDDVPDRQFGMNLEIMPVLEAGGRIPEANTLTRLPFLLVSQHGESEGEPWRPRIRGPTPQT